VADVWLSASVVVLLILATLYALWRRPMVGFWGAWFFITLSPASSVVPIPTEVGAERRMYLPLIAIIVAVALGIDAFVRFARGRVHASPEGTADVSRRTVLVPAILLLAALGAVTIARNVDYRSGIRLWETVLERRPHPRAHTNLASELVRTGRIDDAIRHLRIAAPDWPDARLPLGSILANRGELPEALVHLQEFTRLKPGSRDILAAREELVGVLVRQGNEDQVLEELRKIVAVGPDYVRGRLNLANMLLSRSDYDGAVREYREALKLEPANGRALTELGVALASGGDAGGALDALRQAVRVDGSNLTARSHLLRVLLQQQQFGELERESRMLIGLAPRDADAHNMLGVALASQQRISEAIPHFAEAVRLQPDFPQARNNLAMALNDGRRRERGQ
jgi:Flp pilus assembly protein TadD